MSRGALALLIWAVGTACAPASAPLSRGERATIAPTGLSPRVVARRGALSYQSAFVGTRLWVATELATRFELVVRRLDPVAGSVLELGRVDLGPSDWNTTGLAAADRGPIVWVSSLAGTVRAIDVGSMAVTREWRIGSGATALDASKSGAYVAYGTSTGVICLRRVRDGALLQCVAAHQGPVTALAFDGDHLVSAGGGRLATWSTPALRVVGGRSVSSVVAMAPSPAGLALALGSLDDPSRAESDRPAAGRAALIVINARGLVGECRGHGGAITGVHWAPGPTLVSASIDGSVRLWNVSDAGGRVSCSARAVRRLGQPVWSLTTSPSGAYLAIGLWAEALDQPSALLADVLYPRFPQQR